MPYKQNIIKKDGSYTKDQRTGLFPPLYAQATGSTELTKTHYVKGFCATATEAVFLPPLSDRFINECNILESTEKFENSQEVVKIAIQSLKQNQWQNSTLALINLMHISRHSPKLLDPHMSLINRTLCSLIRNTRRQIVRTACHIATELYETIRYVQRPECDELAAMLLLKSTHKKRDIQSDAQLALKAMVDNLPPIITIHILVGEHGARHKNPFIRGTVSLLIRNVIDKIGINPLLSNYNLKDIRKKILVTYTRFLTDGNYETRSNAKKALKSLMTHADFDTVFNQDVDKKIRDNLEKQIISLKYG
ncbi:hypothetical protein KM043_012820 [Ampulex compressa]|nr:hypothetical protein KM043_012820 [Ampulex compressa]